MSQREIEFTIDGARVKALKGQTILQAAQGAGIYIPRLCDREDLTAHGSCRICTVKVNGRCQAACTTPASEGISVESSTAEIQEFRRALVEMLLAEGNHYCMFCEKSGNCELQALAYRFGVTSSRYPYMFPLRQVDGSHPQIFLDHDRCILCGRCVRASKELDGKNVFQFVGRGCDKRVAMNGENLKDTDLDEADRAAEACPVGALVIKHTGYRVPVGERDYDRLPIGSAIEGGVSGERGGER